MNRSEMVDCGYDYDYAETINHGDEYMWDYDDGDLEMGFDPYEGDYTYDC